MPNEKRRPIGKRGPKMTLGKRMIRLLPVLAVAMIVLVGSNLETKCGSGRCLLMQRKEPLSDEEQETLDLRVARNIGVPMFKKEQHAIVTEQHEIVTCGCFGIKTKTIERKTDIIERWVWKDAGGTKHTIDAPGDDCFSKSKMRGTQGACVPCSVYNWVSDINFVPTQSLLLTTRTTLQIL